MISLFRIDDRLIHAQVVIGWGRVINPHRLVVINDRVANDELKRNLYLSTVPSQYRVSLLTLDEGANQLKEGVYEGEKVIVLVKTPRDVVKLLNSGVSIGEVNVGGMHYSDGKKKILEDIYLSEEDRKWLRELIDRGVELEVRSLPDSTPVILTKQDV